MEKQKEQMKRKLNNLLVEKLLLFWLPRLLNNDVCVDGGAVTPYCHKAENAVLADSPLPDSEVVYLPDMYVVRKVPLHQHLLAVRARVKASICSLLDVAVLRTDISISRSGFQCVAESKAHIFVRN